MTGVFIKNYFYILIVFIAFLQYSCSSSSVSPNNTDSSDRNTQLDGVSDDSSLSENDDRSSEELFNNLSSSDSNKSYDLYSDDVQDESSIVEGDAETLEIVSDAPLKEQYDKTPLGLKYDISEEQDNNATSEDSVEPINPIVESKNIDDAAFIAAMRKAEISVERKKAKEIKAAPSDAEVASSSSSSQQVFTGGYVAPYENEALQTSSENNLHKNNTAAAESDQSENSVTVKVEKKEEVYKHKIDLYTNKNINTYIKLYTVTKRESFRSGMLHARKYMAMIEKVLREYELPLELANLAYVESNFNPLAISHAGAAGMWQFIRPTGRRYDLDQSYWLDMRFDPYSSTVAAARYLKHLHSMFGNWEHALAAYNTGSGNVRKAIKRNKKLGKPTDFWSLKLPRETRGYVPAFFAVSHIKQNLENYGFESFEAFAERKVKKLEVPGSVALKTIANELGIPEVKLKEHNLALKLDITPPDKKSFSINIPNNIDIDNKKALFNKLSSKKIKSNFRYTIKKGDTLWDLSRKFKVSVASLKKENKGLSNTLRIGDKITVPANVAQSSSKYAILTDYHKISTSAPSRFKKYRVYRVRKGDSLSTIARKYRTSIRKLVRTNRNLRSSRQLLQIGMKLRIY